MTRDAGGDEVLPPGLYERLLTSGVARALPGLEGREETGDLPPAEADWYLAEHVVGVVRRVLQAPGWAHHPQRQVALCNALVATLVRTLEEQHDPTGDVRDDRIDAARLLLAVVARGGGGLAQPTAPPRPSTPLAQNALFVGGPHEPALAAELGHELASADRVDVLCAFVIWSGVRVLRGPLRRLRARGVPVRVITTTYTGATEPRALDELAALGAQIRVSYDARSTRLHAKAWLFERASGFSTAYVGSSNLSHAALHDGLEWNVRLSQVSSPDLLERFRATFEPYWASPEFEPYDPERFDRAVRRERAPASEALTLFDLRPYPFQEEMLERLEVERERHGRWRNLVVAATGTGKTVVSAFDYRRVAERWGAARLLFVAHRQEILRQSLATFRAVLRDPTFGELLVGGWRPREGRHVFASVQSLRRVDLGTLDPSAYDVVIVDEFHHAEAPTYRRLLEHLRPRLLLGLTATPERADGLDVTRWFGGRIAVELRLWEALEQGLLCPFQYFGIADGVDLSRLEWRRRGYDLAALSGLYTGNDARMATIIRAVRDLVQDPRRMRALAFCVSVEHARYVADCFVAAGIAAEAVSGDTAPEARDGALHRLRTGETNALCSVDLFNEGLDVPQVDTVLLLRPTESATVFLQQLGRGLRPAPRKAGLTVLDFIGQQHRQFRFEPRFAALTGARRRELVRQIEDGFPFLPAGCSVQLDRVSQEVVVANVRQALLAQRRAVLADELRQLGDVSLATFLAREPGHSLDEIYRGGGGGWAALRRRAGLPAPAGPDEARLARAIGRLRHVDDEERVACYTRLLSAPAPPPIGALSPRQRRLVTMLHFGLWGADRRLTTLEASLARFWEHPALRDELVQLLGVLGQQATHRRAGARLAPDEPLWAHVRYTRPEALAALGDATAERPPSSREGVRYIGPARTDVFFVTLQKTAGRFSPTTMYRDYAVSPALFHWELQSTTAATSPTGQRYIHHADLGTRVCLFAREVAEDEAGGTVPFLFLGLASYLAHRGGRPMAVTWRLDPPLPADFFQAARAVA